MEIPRRHVRRQFKIKMPVARARARPMIKGSFNNRPIELRGIVPTRARNRICKTN